jgi:hypothetical protein
MGRATESCGNKEERGRKKIRLWVGPAGVRGMRIRATPASRPSTDTKYVSFDLRRLPNMAMSTLVSLGWGALIGAALDLFSAPCHSLTILSFLNIIQ